MPIIEISSLSHPGVEIFSTLTEASYVIVSNLPKASSLRKVPKSFPLPLMQDINRWHSYANRNTLRVMPQLSSGAAETFRSIQEKGVACHAYRMYPDPRSPLRHASS